MSSTSNEVLNVPYFSLASIYATDPSNQSNNTEDYENMFWSGAFNSDNINFKSPVKKSTFAYNAGEVFSSELKNSSENHSDPFWGLISFQDEKINDEASIQNLEIDNLEEWISVPFGGIFASYQKQK